MATSMRFTSADLECLPEDGKRYEIIDGELYVTRQPDLNHQLVCMNIGALLNEWSLPTGAGTAYPAPGVIFAEDDDVAPDVVWASTERLAQILGDDGHLHGAPELVVEVLSPGAKNERRDRDVKQKLYSRQGVQEYWIVNWRARSIEVFRRSDGILEHAGMVTTNGAIESPHLPGFTAPPDRIFAGVRELHDR